MRRLAVSGLIALAIVGGACSGGVAEKKAVDNLNTGLTATSSLTATSTARFMGLGDFTAASQPFSAALRARLSPAQLQASWSAATSSLGQFVSVGAVAQTPQGESTLFTVPVTFTGGSTTVRMQFDRQGQIVDLTIG